MQALHSDGYRENNDLQQRNAFADLRTRRDDLTFYLTATGERQNLDLPGGRTVNLATGENLFEDDPDGANTPYDWADQDTVTVMPGMNVRIGDHSRLHLDFSGRRKEQSYYFFDPGFPTYGETDVDSYSVNPRFTSQFQAAGLTHNTTVGWDLYDYRLENRSAAGKGDIGDPTSTKDLDQRRYASPRASTPQPARPTSLQLFQLTRPLHTCRLPHRRWRAQAPRRAHPPGGKRSEAALFPPPALDPTTLALDHPVR